MKEEKQWLVEENEKEQEENPYEMLPQLIKQSALLLQNGMK